MGKHDAGGAPAPTPAQPAPADATDPAVVPEPASGVLPQPDGHHSPLTSPDPTV